MTKCSLSVWNGIAEVNAVVLCDDEIVRAHQRLSLELVGQHLARRGENPNFRVSRLRPNETTLVIIRKTHSAIGIFEIRRNVVLLGEQYGTVRHRDDAFSSVKPVAKQHNFCSTFDHTWDVGSNHLFESRLGRLLVLRRRLIQDNNRDDEA